MPETLAQTLRRIITSYNTPQPTSSTFYLEDPAQQLYALVAIANSPSRAIKRKSSVIVMAQIQGDSILIHASPSDNPLSIQLIQAGIPKHRIVLAHLGDKTTMIPTTQRSTPLP